MNKPGKDRNGRSGFALILVVWILVLIGAIGTYMVANGRAETAIAHNVRAAANAQALADAGIARTVFNQVNPDTRSRWPLDGRPHRLLLPGGEVVVRLEDESQKINPNLASEALLVALFQLSGVESRTALHLGAAVADWVSADGPAREGGAKLSAYRAAGRSYGPANAPLESLDELQLVLGMTPAIMASVRPYLTIYSQTPAPDGKSAPLLIQRAIALAPHLQVSEQANAKPDAKPQAASAQQSPDPQQPANAQTPANAAPQQLPADERLIAAHVTARSRDGGVFVRYAVLKLQPQGSQPYTVLEWQRGALDSGDPGAVSD